MFAMSLSRLNLRSIIPEKVPTPAKIFLFGLILNGLGNGILNTILHLSLIFHGFDSVSLSSILILSSIGSAVLTMPIGILTDHYRWRKIWLDVLLFYNFIVNTCVKR